MAFQKIEFTAPSTDGIHTLRGVVYLPDGNARGYFHIVHGMTEHIGRYHRFMSDMADAGYICFGYDNLGHGNTADNDSELGFIAKKNGDVILARDVKAYSDAVMSRYGENGLPYCLMGHSMGSFIVRRASELCVHPDKLIIMGTGGKNPAAGIALALIGVIRLLFGDKHYSPLMDKLAFGSYNRRFGGGTPDDPKPWLTNDTDIRRKYYADKFCAFSFTVSAMGDLIRSMKLANRSGWYERLSKDIPILLVSGSEDPVGNYGKGVREVEAKLQKQGINTKCVIYEGARHEILNDFTYEQVTRDVTKFLEQ